MSENKLSGIYSNTWIYNVNRVDWQAYRHYGADSRGAVSQLRFASEGHAFVEYQNVSCHYQRVIY